MAHWLLRERMAEHHDEGRGHKDEQHRPEQNKSYDEPAAPRGPAMPKGEVGTGHRRRNDDE